MWPFLSLSLSPFWSFLAASSSSLFVPSTSMTILGMLQRTLSALFDFLSPGEDPDSESCSPAVPNSWQKMAELFLLMTAERCLRQLYEAKAPAVALNVEGRTRN